MAALARGPALLSSSLHSSDSTCQQVKGRSIRPLLITILLVAS
jgi:hypothetical protein